MSNDRMVTDGHVPYMDNIKEVMNKEKMDRCDQRAPQRIYNT